MHVLTVDYTSPNAPSLFCQSLKETGFAVLNNHPVPHDLITQAYQQWKLFFSDDKKYDYSYQKPSQQGYFAFRSENAKNHKVSDLKEFYQFYPGGRIPPALEVVSQTIFDSLQKLAFELLQWIENFLPKHISQDLSMPLRNMIIDSTNTVLRILHYPPLQEKVEEGAMRAAPHEDINLITILPAATSPGLEVLDTNNNWHEVNCNPGNIVVNVGDMLQMCTQNYYKSTTHRVISLDNETNSRSRYSMPFFLHPQEAVRLSNTKTAKEYLHERLREIGIY